MSIIKAREPGAAITVDVADLQGGRAVFCPNPKMPLWSNHPRVFIDVRTTGQGQCPYCGTRYRWADGAVGSGGH